MKWSGRADDSAPVFWTGPAMKWSGRADDSAPVFWTALL